MSSQDHVKQSSPSTLYTPDQVKEVRDFLTINQSDYYAVLCVPKTADADEIKRAYKKQALRFHPDKNQAPGADDAFKAVGTAFACLSDADKRRRYDVSGATGTDRPGSFAFQQDSVNVEDLFNMFFSAFAEDGLSQGSFGGGATFFHQFPQFQFQQFPQFQFQQFPQFPQFQEQQYQTRRRTGARHAENEAAADRRRRQQHQTDTEMLVRIIQLAPLFLLLVFVLLSNLFWPSD
jgi:curved DNA-binding protein CbpA